MSEYAELHCHSWFSLLDGASPPQALAARAARLGLRALALTDHDSLAGVVQFSQAAKQHDLRALFGAEVTLDALDGDNSAAHLTLLAETQRGYANLCKLISAARLDHLPAPAETYDPLATASDWPGKIAPRLSWARLREHAEGIIALTGCRRGPVAAPLLRREEEAAEIALRHLCEVYGRDHLFVELQHHRQPGDDHLARRLCDLARDFKLPVVATNNVHYAKRDGSRLRDALLAIDENIPLSEARRRGLLPGHDLACLAGAEEMARRFGERPEALLNTLRVAERCQASADFSQQRLPGFLPPGSSISEFEYLYALCHENLPRRYPVLRPAVLKQLAHELDVIENAGLAGFFLLVWDIVCFATAQGIRCQGRGSAAGSIVAYLLGITAIDPLEHRLLFERFLSADKHTMPDIDIDFAADRREEVIQYVYRKFGRDHAAMVCNYVTYHARSALRDLSKVLEIPADVAGGWAHRRLGNHATRRGDRIAELAAGMESEAGNERSSEKGAPALLLLADLMRQIDGAPRHLSIHSGGMLITALPLDEVVPLEAATMPGRVIVQWDKDSCEDAGLIKFDILALGMLGAVSEAVALAETMGEPAPDLSALPPDDVRIYRMIQAGDTVGTFQIESRAQIQLLPRLKPANFSDITISVAIIRPGPIQGNAVHPLLRRRDGLEPVQYLHPALEPILRETYGVIVYQEQILQVATTIGGFTPGEADQLRRAMSRARSPAAMGPIRTLFLERARARGIDDGVAVQICNQLVAFSGYGFPKSHSASFALVAYQSVWLKCYRPAAFYCAVINNQPMGFYSVEVLLGDARRHGVDTLPPCAARSDEKWKPERTQRGMWALRTGLSAVAAMGGAGRHALPSAAAARIVGAREQEPFRDLIDFCQRTRLARPLVENLIRAGVCDVLRAAGESRRDLLWQLGEIDYRPEEIPLEPAHTHADLAELEQEEEEVWEHELMAFASGGNVMRHYRAALRRRRIASGWEVKQMARGQRARVAGVMAIRQRPETAKGIVFVSLEDESGLLDLVIKPQVWEKYHETLYREPLVVVEGEVQRANRAVSVLVQHAIPLADLLGEVASDAVAGATKAWF